LIYRFDSFPKNWNQNDKEITDCHKHDGSWLSSIIPITLSDEFYCEEIKISTFFPSFLGELRDIEIRDDFVWLAAGGEIRIQRFERKVREKNGFVISLGNEGFSIFLRSE
jgi:hypothetical protein